jgi:hypothetical protein
MMPFLAWLRCVAWRDCPPSPASPHDQQQLDELRRRTERANRQAAALRLAREQGVLPSWEQMILEGERRK